MRFFYGKRSVERKRDMKSMLLRRIEESGPISFRDYMEMALYEPGLGYYTSSEHRIGKRGDFFTSPYISSAFGAMIGRQIEEMWSDIRKDFKIVEFGAGSGLLCYDILQYLKKNRACYLSIEYIIIEKSPVSEKFSRNYLGNAVTWRRDLKELGSFEGCIISNELFDNFPVSVIFPDGEEWMEVWVDYENGFREISKPASSKLKDYIKSSKLRLPDGVRAFVCLDAEKWYKTASEYFSRGYIITVDYGFTEQPGQEMNAGKRGIRCYKDHRLVTDPYAFPGGQDITSDVNFSDLNRWGAKYGFEFSGIVNQRRFLRALGLVHWLSDMNDSEENKKFAYTTLLEEMGELFKVLIQRKGMPERPLLGLNLQHPAEKKIFNTISL
jgi:SAM-dependent MidA family methyltransferase